MQSEIIDIAVGRDRNARTWRNTKMPWCDLVDKLSETHRTHETQAEYDKATKQRQAEIKDVGGFVAGYLAEGRRKKGSVVHRSALTLDLDFATDLTLETIQLMLSCEWLVYSTHKHRPSAPRLRLVVPLTREVLPDEYVAIARRVAGDIAINEFDDSTFEPSRLMYWPSTSTDGEYVFHHHKGPWLDPDQVLATYHDWRDTSAWPISDRVKEAAHKGADKAGDPTEKPGTIGAFCREYTLTDALETFLGDRYEATANDDGRYTYTLGSTAGGLVVYEDKWAYSHHGTDPVSGRLVNAFDLVRIHLFGDRDGSVKEDTPLTKHPSFTAMEDMILRDARTVKRMATERLEEVKSRFSSWEDTSQGDDTPENNDWLSELDMNKKGECNATIDNALMVLRNDPQLRGLFALNRFSLREVATRHMPWRRITRETQSLKDSDDVGLRHYIETKYNLRSKQCVQDAMVLVCEENGFHPIKDYFNTLTWDGFPRCDNLLIDYLGAADTPYVRAVTRKFLVAAVARILSPGCKYDYVLTLVGAQGIGKSTIFKKLGGDWFSDSMGSIQSKEAYESLQGVWIMEIGELAGLRKADAEAVKHFVSKTEDRYRVAYGRRTETFPRQCVFAGTTNIEEFLNDPTGNRRWWPVPVTKAEGSDLFVDLDNYTVGQIWAEAISLYEAGEPLYLNEELAEEARKVQTEHRLTDDRVQVVMEYLETPVPENWAEMDIWERRQWITSPTDEGVTREKVSVGEIWTDVFKRDIGDLDARGGKDIRAIMAVIPGWEQKVVKVAGVSNRGWVRKRR